MFHRRIESAPSPSVARRPSLLARLWRGWRASWGRRRTLAALAVLDDRLLRDIGLERADLADPGFDLARIGARRVDRAVAEAPAGPFARRRAPPAGGVAAASARRQSRPAFAARPRGGPP